MKERDEHLDILPFGLFQGKIQVGGEPAKSQAVIPRVVEFVRVQERRFLHGCRICARLRVFIRDGGVVVRGLPERHLLLQAVGHAQMVCHRFVHAPRGGVCAPGGEDGSACNPQQCFHIRFFLSGGSADGNSTVNVDPVPTVLATETFPPCPLTTALTKARPIPVPLRFPFTAVDAR